MTSQTWRQVDRLKGFEDFVQKDGCKCFPPLAEPSCPVHGYQKRGVAAVDFISNGESARPITQIAKDLTAKMVEDARKYERLRWLVMKLLSDTVERVPTVALGWDKCRLDEINALCQ